MSNSKKAKIKTANLGITNIGVGFNRLTPEQRSEMARKGGLAISQNREHMSKISMLAQQARKKNKLAKEAAAKNITTN
jgi:hypothetical protein